jgi:hypothetical protein
LPTATSTKTPIPTPDYTATAAAKATQAVAEDLVEIAPILQKYEMPIDIGRLAWVQRRPVEIKVEKYNEWRVIPIDSRLTFSDFAMYVEITWETRSGLAGCGVVFHSENPSIDGEQYRFYGLRFTGLPGWIVQGWKDNRVQSNISGDYKIDKAIILKNGSTNRYFSIMQGGILTLYANGTQLGKMDIPGRIEGYLLFLALQESMKTTCTFENAWVWSLK